MSGAAFPWQQPVPADDRPVFLHDFTFEALTDLVVDMGFSHAAARTLFTGLQRKGYQSFDQFDYHRFPRRLTQALAARGDISLTIFRQISAWPSDDGSVKYLYTTWDGAKIESVHMPFGKRRTLCISSQVGCAMGCTFCATGAMGFKRHLSTAEMVGQVLHMIQQHPDPSGQTTRVNVVFMGMGEPLHNLDNLLKTVEILTHQHGLVLSRKDVAVSTSGLVPKIIKMGEHKVRPRLMVSIAATTDEARAAIMPVNRAYPLEELLQCLETFPLEPDERIMLSYVLIRDVNDHMADAERLAAMAARFPSMVNLIPMNEHEDSPDMKEPVEAHLQDFFRALGDRGCFVTIRRSRGRDVAGACGQLSSSRA